MIHFRAHGETGGNAVARIAGRCGRNVIGRLAARDHTVVATGAPLGRTFKHTADMAGFAGYKLMLAHEWVTGC